MDPSSAPLADYFWIAGVDSLSYNEQLRLVPNAGEKLSNGNPPVASTIEEDKTLEVDDDQRVPASDRHNSFGRLSFGEPRLSIHTVVAETDSKQTGSNRSSATITGIQLNGTGLSDFDFDKALRKFAAERDSFLDELSFSAGTIVPNRPVLHPRTQRVTNEEPSGLKAVGGSIRRRISFRDLNIPSVPVQTPIGMTALRIFLDNLSDLGFST
ncbi:MAG: hypothetical protein M1813_009472 [Trichoglossum hirsutum]|nr:MAG: hypothetical protein M1813_009472 [Trichoglossum hirsutum]